MERLPCRGGVQVSGLIFGLEEAGSGMEGRWARLGSVLIGDNYLPS
jgi:hypothetical protein